MRLYKVVYSVVYSAVHSACILYKVYHHYTSSLLLLHHTSKLISHTLPIQQFILIPRKTLLPAIRNLLAGVRFGQSVLAAVGVRAVTALADDFGDTIQAGVGMTF